MTRITSLTRRKSRSQYQLPRTSTRSPSSVLMILCPLHQVRPTISVGTSQCYPPRFVIAPIQPETILQEGPQSSQQQNREFVVEREGEMPMFAKPSTLPAPQSGFATPNEFRQSMSSTPVSVLSIPVYDAGDDENPRSRSLDPIKVTRSKKKGATGKKKRTSKPEIADT